MSAVKAILFDAVGTLMEPVPTVAAAYRAVALRYGLDVEEAALLPRFRAAFARQEQRDLLPAGLLTNETREYERWQAIVDDVFAGEAAAPVMFNDLWQHFAQPTHWRLYPDAVECLAALAQRGDLTLGIASNFDARLAGVAAGFAELAGIQRIYISSLVGARKPSAQFFATVAADLQLPPSELLLVGDDYGNDFVGATSAGWQALHLERDLGTTVPPGTLRSLTELLSHAWLS